MNCYFRVRTGQSIPENLLCEAEVHFNADTPFAGLKLVGFTLWRAKDNPEKTYVTMPAKPIGGGDSGVSPKQKYFEFLRAADDSGSKEAGRALWRLKDWIVEEWGKAGRPGA